MSNGQKVIKYFAYALAFCIIFGIISAAVSVFAGISSLIDINDNNNSISDELKTLECSGNIELSNLKIDLGYSNLKIVSSNKFEIKSNDSNVLCDVKDDVLVIKDKNKAIKTKHSDVIISLPDDISFDYMDIETGAGRVNIEELYTDRLDLSLGAGSSVIKTLNVNTADIDTGVGAFFINDGVVNNIDLSMGVGASNIKLKVNDYGEFEGGIGKFNLELIGSLEDYKIELNKGIGKCYVSRNELKDNETVGGGQSKIILNGGIGEMNVNFIGE